MALTAKQRQFVAEYLIDLNATQAAIRAGYSARNADKIGPELLGKTRVAEALSSAMQARSARTEITADRVLAEYAKLAFLDPRRFYDANGGLIPVPLLPADVAAALLSMEVTVERSQGEDGPTFADVKKIKFADKKGALDSVARHLGMFNDKLEITGKDGAPIDMSIQLKFVKPA
jgi:phage terminase small subunit